MRERERERDKEKGKVSFKKKVVMKCSNTSECSKKKKKVSCCVFGGI